MDYSLNDDVRAKLDNYFYRMRRAAERQDPQRGLERRGMIIGGYAGSAATVVDMARFVEQITRITTMDIEQTYDSISIEREGTFSLDCRFDDSKQQTHDNPFGKELCGWDGHQLVFYLSLPGGMDLQQRLTLSRDGRQMNVATTLRLDQAPEPFTLNRAYMRFEGLPNHYNCEQTVTRGKVCSLATDTQSQR
ncbi:hypothetical protein FKG94_02840 [Exilibacterium tricleocarpae]|uniref:Uncharacterized protein n=1 Tax=Exilibacterium tricleocarpae TaxID=2591008 RepID=A0A545U6P1_9GAMM|nr:hypothetical protein [Exilibacterium tricleocarpae]TQV85141.1 hypothetical protein FKG94_02840 [Exilibacterium tricleocarpae]